MLPKKKRIQSEEEKRHEMFKVIGFIAGLFSKFLLEQEGFDINFRINGERIQDIDKLAAMDISERIKLAVKEERYEDAANLKRLLDHKQTNHENSKS